MAGRSVFAHERLEGRIANIAVSGFVETNAHPLAAKQEDHEQDAGDNGHGGTFPSAANS